MRQARLRARLLHPLAALLVVVMLTGCAGGLGLLLQLVAAGNLIGDVSNLLTRFEKPATEYRVFFDGYPLGQRPDNTGRLDLRGLPAGRHLLSVVDTEYRTGFHQIVNVVAGDTALQLADYNPVFGAVISGRVERETATGGRSQVARTLVVAILNGANMLQQGAGETISIPPTDDSVTYIMGYTDDTGIYRLGPAIYGSWLVLTAMPGHYGDARVVVTSGAGDSANQNLLLPLQQASPVGAMLGSVTQTSGQGIAEALVYTQLQQPYQVEVAGQRATEVSNSAGFALIAQPWFAWNRLGAITDGAGIYALSSRPGVQTVTAFKYGFHAKLWNGELGLGATRLDFDLTPR